MMKILVIHEEQVVRTYLDRLLSRQGYEVVLAEGGQRGLDLFGQERPHAVILNLKMCDMDGIVVLQEMRLVDKNLPIIVLTGSRNLEMAQQAQTFGVTEFIEKEVSLHCLLDSLKHHLDLYVLWGKGK